MMTMVLTRQRDIWNYPVQFTIIAGYNYIFNTFFKKGLKLLDKDIHHHPSESFKWFYNRLKEKTALVSVS